MPELKYNPFYYEKDPAKKNSEWISTIISAIRQEWMPVLKREEALRNVAILKSEQGLEKVKNYFKQGAYFRDNEEWKPIAFWENIRNTLVAEYIKSAYEPTIKAEDASALTEKEQDAALLQNRAIIESLVSDVNAKIGDPPYKVPKDKYNGDVQKFDEMGLDSNSPEDVSFYKDNFHRLYHEASAEKVVRNLLIRNEFKNKVEDIINDILAKNAVAFQTYASPYTGEIKWEYLDPLVMKAIKGKRNDFKDAMALGWEENVTVRQFLEFAGPDFDFNRDKQRLVEAINTSNYTTYAYLTAEGCFSINEKGEHYLAASYPQVLGHMVAMGYMQFKSIDGVAKKQHNKSKLFYDIRYDEDLSNSKSYTKVVDEYEKTYHSYYLGTGYNTQMIFRAGPLYHQLTYGAGDVYSSFSIFVFTGTGQSAVEISAPFIRIIQEAYYKMLWAISESIPREKVVTYEAIAALISKLKPENKADLNMGNNLETGEKIKVGSSGLINDVIQMFTRNLTKVVATPQIEGVPIQGVKPYYYTEGGLDPLAVAMTTTMDWAETQILKKIGWNPLRSGDTPDPKDGFKSGQSQIKTSQNTTYYVPFMLNFVLENSCISSLMISQDAVQYDTPVKTFLETLVGKDDVENIKALGKTPFHSYGMSVDIMNVRDNIEDNKILAQMSLRANKITTAQYYIVINTGSPLQAGLLLSFFEQKEEKKKMQQAQQAQQNALQLDQVRTQNQAYIIQLKGQVEANTANITGEWRMRSLQKPADAALQKKQMDIENNAQKQQEHADATIKIKEAEERIKNQQPLPAAASESEVRLLNAL